MVRHHRAMHQPITLATLGDFLIRWERALG
jgi:hypothetical protein